MSLETYNVVECRARIILPQLHNGKRPLARLRIVEAHGLQRAEEQRVLAAGSHDLHGHAAFEELLFLEVVRRRFLRMDELVPEGAVLRLIHGTVDVVRRALTVARGAVGLAHIHRLEAHDRRRRIIEIEAVIARARGNVPGQSARRQRAASHDGDGIVAEGNALHFLVHDRDARMLADLRCHIVAEAMTIHGQRTACGHARGIGRRHDYGMQAAHLLFQHAHSIFETGAAQ